MLLCDRRGSGRVGSMVKRAAVAVVAAGAVLAGSSGVAVAAPAGALVLGPGSEIETQLRSAGVGRALFAQCTLGVVANGPTGRVAITAGHCAPVGHLVGVRIPAGGHRVVVIGRVSAASIPRSVPTAGGDLDVQPEKPDWGVIRFDPGVALAAGRGRVQPTGVAQARLGERVCQQGITTGWQCGVVVAVAGHRVATDIPVREGDSGGPLVDQASGAVLGILSTGGRQGRQSISVYWDLGFVLAQAGGLTLATV